MTDLTTDARLVTDFLAGDKSALAAIYDRYASGLYDTAAAMLSDRHDAADMVQDVFCIAAERLGQLREPDRLKPWLYSVLRHEVYRRTKKRKRATPVDFQDEGTPDVASGYDPQEAGEAVAYDELATLVRSAASGLDERDRLVLELSVRQGLSGADLADALGVTPEQSYSLVHRMRDRVEKSLGALTVAKAGRRDCSQLAQILTGWDGELTILLRKRVNRHIEECSTCERTRKKYAPLALFGAAPVFAMPFGLRERVLAAAIPGGGSTGNASETSGSQTSNTSSSASSRSTRTIEFDAHKGFPKAVRAGRHVVAWAATATAIVVIGGGVIVATAGDESSSPDRAIETPVDAPSAGDGTDSFGSTVTGDDRETVSGGGAMFDLFGDSTGEIPAVTTAGTNPVSNDGGSDGGVGGAGGPASGPTAPATTSAPVPSTRAPIVPIVPETTEAPTTTTTAAPVSVQSLQMSTTKLNFGTTATAVKVTLRNPNTFPVNFSTVVTSARFVPSPASGSLGAGEQISFAVNFDRTGAVADPKNFPTGAFSHTLTATATDSGGRSSVRTATLYGTIERTSTTTTTATTTTTTGPTTTTTTAPAIGIKVASVSGSLGNCVALDASASITTNGKVSTVTVQATFRRKNLLTNQWVVLGTSSPFSMSAGASGSWVLDSAKVVVPQGTQNVLLSVSASTSTGQSASGSGSFSTTC